MFKWMHRRHEATFPDLKCSTNFKHLRNLKTRRQKTLSKCRFLGCSLGLLNQNLWEVGEAGNLCFSKHSQAAVTQLTFQDQRSKGSQKFNSKAGKLASTAILSIWDTYSAFHSIVKTSQPNISKRMCLELADGQLRAPSQWSPGRASTKQLIIKKEAVLALPPCPPGAGKEPHCSP